MADKNKEFLRTLKFVGFSASAGIIELVSYALLFDVLHFLPWLAHLLSLVLSVLWNFTLNRKFTFCSAANVPIAMAKVACFYLVFTPLSTWWTAVLTGEGFGWNEYLALALTMITNFLLEYLYDRFFVFRDSIDTAKSA